MIDDTASKPQTWLEKLIYSLLREPKDREQLLYLLRDAEQHHILDAEALTMIEGVLQISEMKARDLIIPRAKMVVIEAGMPLQHFLPLVIESGHSRFPVVNGVDRDEVLGILLAKDLLKYQFENQQIQFNIKNILRPAVFIPESKRLDVLLQEFRSNRNHLAIVVDEYGGVAGLITIEDILEEIVGEISDEYDIGEEIFIKQQSLLQFIVKGVMPIEEFNEYFKVNLDPGNFDTIAGLIAHQFGHLPKKEEETTLGNLRFKILRADKRRIRLLQVNIKKKLNASFSS